MSIAIAETPRREQPPSAAQLAARIPVPVRLPVRHDGQPIRHLSASSYGLWVMCREAWRRKYICGEREAPSGAMFLGSRVDDAVSLYYRRIIDEHERLDLGTGQGRLPRPVADRARRRAREARRQLGRHPSAGRVRAGTRSARADVRTARATPRRAGRGPATAGVHARARTASGRSSATWTSRPAAVR